jgi:hypothetical protein
MKLIDVPLEDDLYEKLQKEATTGGQPIHELIQLAIDDVYGVGYRNRLRRALFATAGIADPDDFDGLSGEDYVDKIRGGWGGRAWAVTGE